MDFLTIAIIGFLVLETLNVLMLYFLPGANQGNGLGAFKAYEKSKLYPEIYALIKYLSNWVAGTKIIFIALLLVILVHGDGMIKSYAVAALCFSICTYYVGLYPLIKKQDEEGNIAPKGYSKTLSWMITGFLIIFTLASIISYRSQNAQDNISLQGSWKLIKGTVIRGEDSLATDYTQDREMIKIINEDHFAFMHHDLTKGKQDEPVFVAGGGRYTLDGNIYTEYLDYCNYREWEDHVFEFRVSLRNDTLTIKGIEKVKELGIDQINIETYLRVVKNEN